MSHLRRIAGLAAAVMVALSLSLCGIAGIVSVAPTPALAKTAKAIGKAKATKIALKDAGFTKSQVKKLKVKSSKEDGHKVYEVDFRRGKYEYEYDIDKYTGKIIDEDKARIKSSKKAISKAKATKIALKDAGFTKCQVKNLKVESDIEDGHRVFEVEFSRGKYEYGYDIDKYSGKIVDRDKDRI